jgi:hypothetical protein
VEPGEERWTSIERIGGMLRFGAMGCKTLEEGRVCWLKRSGQRIEKCPVCPHTKQTRALRHVATRCPFSPHRRHRFFNPTPSEIQEILVESLRGCSRLDLVHL